MAMTLETSFGLLQGGQKHKIESQKVIALGGNRTPGYVSCVLSLGGEF